MTLLEQYNDLRNKLISIAIKTKQDKRTETGRDIYEWDVGNGIQQLDVDAGAEIPEVVLLNAISVSIRIKLDEMNPSKQDYIM